MIQIENKQLCVGCNACTQICPKRCITMIEDVEGFLYPEVDVVHCIDCGRCEQVCPVINQEDTRVPQAVYAAKNTNETIRKESSSGGVFTLLAEQVIDQGGVVFGAGFNSNWEVVHSYTETLIGLQHFRGSKYVQSVVGESFKQVAQFLKKERKVLFSGTPCQVAGLKQYLGKKSNSNLFTVDFICHGVPSPKVFRLYLDEFVYQKEIDREKIALFPLFKKGSIKDIQFRNKTFGWKNYSFVLSLADNVAAAKTKVLLAELSSKNTFMRGFLKDLYLRPSCHACPSKCFKSGSDITIGDFWGIENHYPAFDDDKGCSLVLIHSMQGVVCYSAIEKSNVSMQVEYATALAGNPSMVHSSKEHPMRTQFFSTYTTGKLIETIQEITKPSFKQQFIAVAYSLAKRCGVVSLIKQMRK